MNEEKRINGGYEIIESCTIGSNELVIGHNPKAPNPYVCWYCTTCPYPRYKDGSVIFCDVCIRKILDEQKEKKQRKEQPDGE